jgi:hypothetical protein
MTLNMFKAHTADDPRSILDGSHAVSIVWVLGLGNQIANGYNIGDRTHTVDECFEAASDFNHMEGGCYSSDMESAVYTRLPLTSAGYGSRGTMVECVVGLASKIVFGVWVVLHGIDYFSTQCTPNRPRQISLFPSRRITW